MLLKSKENSSKRTSAYIKKILISYEKRSEKNIFLK